MKKMKFIFVAFAVLLFSAVVTNAQNKEVETDSWDYEGFMDCTDDYVWGVETMVVITWDSKFQARYKGEYESSSGKHYTWSLVVNDNWKRWKEGQAAFRTYSSTSVIECDGVPIAIYKIRFHASINANGEIVVERYWDSGDGWVCL